MGSVTDLTLKDCEQALAFHIKDREGDWVDIKSNIFRSEKNLLKDREEEYEVRQHSSIGKSTPVSVVDESEVLVQKRKADTFVTTGDAQKEAVLVEHKPKRRKVVAIDDSSDEYVVKKKEKPLETVVVQRERPKKKILVEEDVKENVIVSKPKRKVIMQPEKVDVLKKKHVKVIDGNAKPISDTLKTNVTESHQVKKLIPKTTAELSDDQSVFGLNEKSFFDETIGFKKKIDKEYDQLKVSPDSVTKKTLRPRQQNDNNNVHCKRLSINGKYECNHK